MARVLIVDDDEPTRDVIRMLLEDNSFTVSEAGDGDEALRMLRESGEPLVVLLDLDLPGTDGLGVLQAFAAEPALLAHRHRVIMMTAVSTVRSGSTRELREALDVVLLPKPFDVDVLLAAVNGAASVITAHS